MLDEKSDRIRTLTNDLWEAIIARERSGRILRLVGRPTDTARVDALARELVRRLAMAPPASTAPGRDR